MNSVKSMGIYTFTNVDEFKKVMPELKLINDLLLTKTLGKILSNSPVTVNYGLIKGGVSKACCFRSKDSHGILLHRELTKKLAIRNILIESCHLIYLSKRKHIYKKIMDSISNQKKVTKKTLIDLKIGKVDIGDAEEVNNRLKMILNFRANTELFKTKIKVLTYEVTEYYSVKYFDSLCDFLEESKIYISKKRFSSLSHYLTIQEASGHSDLYAEKDFN